VDIGQFNTLTMTSFSITAPRFTEKDNAREMQELSHEERDAIEDDLYGISSFEPFPETAELKANAIQQLDEAIALVSDAEKVHYLKALKTCPQLVRLESDPILFLRAESFNTWVSACLKPFSANKSVARFLLIPDLCVKAAAERLIKYWSMRCKIFGETAFLPIVATGHGALSRAATAMLSEHYCLPLKEDSKGRAVVYYDRSRLKNSTEFRNAIVSLDCIIWLLPLFNFASSFIERLSACASYKFLCTL
jgi:hypothetical protein